MVYPCIVQNCKNIGTHRFPKDEHRKAQWIEAIKQIKPGLSIRKHSLICLNHFLRKDFAIGFKKLGQSAAMLYKELESNIWALKTNTPQEKDEKPPLLSLDPVKKHKPSWFFISAKNKVNQLAKPKKKEAPEVTFQQAMMVPLIIGQVLGLYPVLGIFQKDATKVKFHFKSWKLLYSVLLCLGPTIATGLSIYRLFRLSMTYDLIAFVSFYGSVCLTSAQFLFIARKWPSLMLEVRATELVDPNRDTRLKWKCQVASVTVMALAVLEHILSVLARYAEILDCFQSENDLYSTYMRRTFPWMFELIPISLPLSIYLQTLNVFSTINWNYSDIFIICISFYLSSRLEQINRKLTVAKGKYLPSQFWRKMREDYNRVTLLVRKFDDVISGVVFTSFATNLFFICLQLFNSLGNGIKHGLSVDKCPNFPSGVFHGYEHAIYFIYSMAFLMVRSFLVSTIASGVHSASLVPAESLYSVPSPVYCTEVQRFLDQLHGQTVALTGLRFFNVTRGLVLTVAGTIATYELVLLQFNMTG